MGRGGWPGPADLMTYYGLDEEALRAVEGVDREAHLEEWVSLLFFRITSQPWAQDLVSDEEARERMREGHRRYLADLLRPPRGIEDLEVRRRIAEVHDRLGVRPWMYMGALAHLVDRILRTLEPVQARALVRLLLLDAGLVLEEYCARREARMAGPAAGPALRPEQVPERLWEVLRGHSPGASPVDLLRGLMNALRFHAAEAWRVRPEEGEVERVASTGLASRRPARQRLGEGLVGWVGLRGEARVCRLDPGRLEEEPECRDLCGSGFRLWVAMPVRHRGEVKGVLCLGAVQARPWGDAEQALAEECARVLARYLASPA